MREARRDGFGVTTHSSPANFLAHLDYADETIATLSERIEEVIRPFAEDLAPLDTIHGVAQRTAEVLIAELGVDMTQFPSDRHLASWAGLCPGATKVPEAQVSKDGAWESLAANGSHRSHARGDSQG